MPLSQVRGFVEAVQTLVQVLPSLGDQTPLPPALTMQASIPPTSFSGYGLASRLDVEQYVGSGTEAQMPTLADLNSVPSRAQSADQAMAAIVKCHQLCTEV